MKCNAKRCAFTIAVAALVGLYVGAGDVAAQPRGGAPSPRPQGAARLSDGGGGVAASAPPQESLTTTGITFDGGSAVAARAPTPRRASPAAPTPSQVAALEALRAEVGVYEKGARDYRDTVTSIIKLHYEAKKKEILSGLDREVAVEKGELRKAREQAIARLEEFIRVYSGARSQPEATPDAMYRLAALYEERARSEDAAEPLDVGLRPSIALYKRVVREYPSYREIAGIYYFLGHALNDCGRTSESQQVWRALVCANHYPYPVPVDPRDPDLDVLAPQRQDHDEAYWNAWRAKYRDGRRVSRANPDTFFSDPYYEGQCAPLPQPGLVAGQAPKYVAEIWWQIGNWEFDQLDIPSGVTRDDPASVWGYNRAAAAYTEAMKFQQPPLFGVALYKYSWTLFKQQRYEAATREFVHLLSYTDEQQKLTGDSGADFRSEAYTYIAGSLTNVDFRGPEAWEPYILRPDILDTEPRPDIAEKKLHIALDRVKDDKLVPQDRPWTIEIYKALALEFRSLNQFNNAVETYETMLARWPMAPTAPETQNAIAETYDLLNVTKRPGTAEHDAVSQRALEARTKLANYIGTTAWVDANKDNPNAIQRAETLVRGGLRQAAAQHTNNGRAGLVAANETGDPGRQVELLSRASTEYRLAAIGWFGYLKQDENAPDAYESRYWLADARRQNLRVGVILHKLAGRAYPEPSKKDIDEALAAAIEVRDSNEDDRYLDNAAFFVVDVSDVERDLAFQRFDEGRGGVERRTEVRFDSNDAANRKVVREPLPGAVGQSVQARDEYVRLVPAGVDLQHHANEYLYYSAEQFFLYGQFDLAKQRLEPLWKDHCGKDEFGYRAWEKLITMSNLERDADRSRELAEAERTHSCAVNSEQAGKAGLIVNPTLQEAAYVDARRKFDQAQKAGPGPERQKLWRDAGGLYEAALSAAPARDEAPEAAMNAAYAYKQVGEYNKAIELYNKFLNEYGSEERLSILERGDSQSKTPADPRRYQERVGYLASAYEALATTYYSFFNYQRAAETNEKVARSARFDEKRRRDAANNAMVLYSNLGERDKMLAEYHIVRDLHPSVEDQASASYQVASYDYKQWNSQGSDTGQNRQFRLSAEHELMGFYQQHLRTPGAAKYLVEAAYRLAKMKKSVGDGIAAAWFKNTVSSWNSFDRAAPRSKDGKSEAQVAPYVDYAAEADFALLDEEISRSYDAPDKHRYQGAVSDVVGETNAQGKLKRGRYQDRAREADQWDKVLEGLARKYESVEWVPTAIARQGTLFDELRTGLYNTTPPALKYFTPKEQTFLNNLHRSGRQDLDDKANELEDAKKEFWRKKKEQELSGADQVMVRRYATAVALARKYSVRNAWLAKAVARLAYFTDIVGDAKMAEYVTATPDPTGTSTGRLPYQAGQYAQTRPGLTVLPPPSGDSVPLPAAP